MIRAMLLIAVVADELQERAVAILREEGARGVTFIPARGINFPEHMTFFGLTYRGVEQVIVCLLDETTAESAAARLNRELDLLKPFKGLAFCLRPGAVGGMDAGKIRRAIEAEHANRPGGDGPRD